MIRSAPLAAGRRHSLAGRDDGTVVAGGDSNAGECDVRAWREIISIAAGNVHAARNTGRSHSVGLRADGTVVATGWDLDGQCAVSDWSDIQAVAAGWRTTLGLRHDGTVVAAGRQKEGQIHVETWHDVTTIACGDWHAVRTDGIAVAAGISVRHRARNCLGEPPPHRGLATEPVEPILEPVPLGLGVRSEAVLRHDVENRLCHVREFRRHLGANGHAVHGSGHIDSLVAHRETSISRRRRTSRPNSTTSPNVPNFPLPESSRMTRTRVDAEPFTVVAVPFTRQAVG